MDKAFLSFGRFYLTVVILISVVGPFGFRTSGATFTVTTTSSSGPGSLAVAVAQANAAPGDSVIEFAVSGTLTPVVQLPVITKNLTFNVRTPNTITIDGRGTLPIFSFAAGTTSLLNGLQVVNGRSDGDAGAINNAGTLLLNNCVLSNHVAFNGRGGAIKNTGQLTILGSTIQNCQAATGGAIYNSGDVAIRSSILSANSASHDSSGGAVYNAGTMQVTQSSFAGNQAGNGGAIQNRRGVENG